MGGALGNGKIKVANRAGQGKKVIKRTGQPPKSDVFGCAQEDGVRTI